MAVTISLNQPYNLQTPCHLNPAVHFLPSAPALYFVTPAAESARYGWQLQFPDCYSVTS